MSTDEQTRTKSVRPADRAEIVVELLVPVGEGDPRRVVLDRDSTIIGRGTDVDVRLDFEGVSRRHARITRAGRTLTLVDLGAKNGTWLNGERIDVTTLHHADLIQIGDHALEVVIRRAGDDLAGASGERPVSDNSADVPAMGLSPREWEVACEVAQGATNADVAKKLGISRRTVATHLERIYHRLDIHSRAALARLVALNAASGP